METMEKLLINCFYVRNKADAIKLLNLVKKSFKICEKETFFKKSATEKNLHFVKITTVFEKYKHIYQQYEEIKDIVRLSNIQTF
jgi:hypothetical protein